MKKSIFAILALALATATPAMAQEKDYEPAPYTFIGIQGGVQNTFNKEFNNWKTFTPTASISVGHYFSPVVGARLHFNGIWDKAGVDHLNSLEDTHYNYNYVTGDVDMLLNLCTLFGKKDWYPINLIFVGGVGANYAWEGRGRAEEAAAVLPNTFLYNENDNRWAFNGRVGLILDIPLHKNVSLNLEADLNHISPGSAEKFNTDRLQFLGQLGLNFKFGYKKIKKAEPVVEQPVEEWTTRIDTIWYDDTVYEPSTAKEEGSWNVFYGLAESNFDAETQLKAIGNFLKDYRDCKIIVKSYADKGTGNATINKKLSEERTANAVKALTDAGVDASMITAESYGDTVQPFAENDKNRVTIITTSGLKDSKVKKTVKKFRTEQKRVRVR